MNQQIDALVTASDNNLKNDLLRDLLDNEIILIGGGEAACNGY